MTALDRFLKRPSHAGHCEGCDAPVETRLRRHAICRDCVMSVVTAQRYPTDRSARVAILRLALEYGFRPEHAFHDPDELIAFMQWCSRRAPGGLEDELYRWIGEHLAPAAPRRSA